MVVRHQREMASSRSQNEVYFTRGGVQAAARSSGLVEYDAAEARKNARKQFSPRHAQPLKVKKEKKKEKICERRVCRIHARRKKNATQRHRKREK